jgi:Flp pilus assembly pilin Flp
MIKKLLLNNQGQAISEFGLILGLLALLVISAFIFFGQSVSNLYSNFLNSL